MQSDYSPKAMLKSLLEAVKATNKVPEHSKRRGASSCAQWTFFVQKEHGVTASYDVRMAKAPSPVRG